MQRYSTESGQRIEDPVPGPHNCPPAALLHRLKRAGVTVRVTKRDLVVHGPIHRLDIRLFLALRRREAELADHLRNPWGDPKVAEELALDGYAPRRQSATTGPLEAGERRAYFEVPASGHTHLVEVVRSAADRQYMNRLVDDGFALARRFTGADFLPLPAESRRLEGVEAEDVRRRLLACRRCGGPMERRPLRRRGNLMWLCSEQEVFQGDGALDTAGELIRRTVTYRGPMRWRDIVAELASHDNPCAQEAAEELLVRARKTAGVVFARGGGKGAGAGAGVWMLADVDAGADLDAELARLLDEEGA